MQVASEPFGFARTMQPSNESSALCGKYTLPPLESGAPMCCPPLVICHLEPSRRARRPLSDSGPAQEIRRGETRQQLPCERAARRSAEHVVASPRVRRTQVQPGADDAGSAAV